MTVVYYEITRICLEQLRGNLQMAGMGRVIRSWGRRSVNAPGVRMLSCLPASLSEEAIEMDPTFNGITADAWVADIDRGWSRLFRKLIKRSGRSRSLFSRGCGFLAFQITSRLSVKKPAEIFSAVPPAGEHWIYHLPLPAEIPRGLPSGCIPVVSIYDVVPFVFTDTYSNSDRKLFQKVIDSVKSGNAHVIVNSVDTKHSLVCYFALRPDRIHVVPLGADSQLRLNSEAIPPPPVCKNPFFLYVASSGQRRKNIEGAMLGFQQFLRRSGEAADLVIVGKGTDIHQPMGDRLTTGLPGKIRCLGGIDEEFLEQLYRHAKVGLYLSLYEGFGLPILEYMIRGVPVLCGNETSLPEVAGEAAVLVDSLNPAAMGAAMESLWTNPELRGSLIKKGILRAADFTWDASYRRLLACYTEILALRTADPNA